MPYAVPNPLSGYRELNDAELAVIEQVKTVERIVADVWATVGHMDDTTNVEGGDPVTIDGRWHALARTRLQEGFSALVRSVARPEDVFRTALDARAAELEAALERAEVDGG